MSEREPRNFPVLPTLPHGYLSTCNTDGSRERISEWEDKIRKKGAMPFAKLITDCLLEDIAKRGLGHGIIVSEYLQTMNYLMAVFFTGMEKAGYSIGQISPDTVYRLNDDMFEEELEAFKQEHSEFSELVIKSTKDFDIHPDLALGPFARLAVDQRAYNAFIQPSTSF